MANSAWRRIMQTPVEIDFQGMSGTPEVHASIEKHVAELEQRYGRVTACRVVLKGPGGHHRTGGLYEVNVRFALPNGREVNVGGTAQADERPIPSSGCRPSPTLQCFRCSVAPTLRFPIR